MCTAISFSAAGHYFGRNLDFERRYRETVTITPRYFVFDYKFIKREDSHYAIIGTATVEDNYPLYYDATNEHGLSIAGLNFVGNSYLHRYPLQKGTNLAPYELIPFLLGKCKTVKECTDILRDVNLIDIPFNANMPNAELHWLIADKYESITYEYTKNGARIYENTVGVLTNNPQFEYHMMNLNNYMQLSRDDPCNTFAHGIKLDKYSRGMGTLGLPGDFSSSSRFVRACFVKLNSIKPSNVIESVGQMFHILGSVEQQEGSVKVGNSFERTQYTSCCDTDRCVYYYKTYGNNRINAVDMYRENIDSDKLISYDMKWEEDINYIN